MSPVVVIIGIRAQHAAQMAGAENDLGIEIFTPYRSDQPLVMTVRSLRMQTADLIAYVHGAQPSTEDGTIGAVIVADEQAWGAVLAVGLGDPRR